MLRSISRRAALAATVLIVLSGLVGASATEAEHGHSATITVQDIAIPVPGQRPVTAYLVRPSGHARPSSLAGVLYLHWFEPPESTQNRTEFLAEAITVARRGAVAVLPDLTFPWQGTVHGDERDRTAITNQLDAVTRAYHTLIDQPGVDRDRTAVVGHDYGAMYGALLAQREGRIRAEVFMAGDATWSNWFATYFVDVPDRPAYDALFTGLDPVDNVSRLGAHLYFQFAGEKDIFVTPAVRDRFAAANPAAKVSLYPRASHFLNQPALDERIPWLADRLGLN